MKIKCSVSDEYLIFSSHPICAIDIFGDDEEISNASVHLTYESVKQLADALYAHLKFVKQSVPMLLWCPQCGERHIDAGEFATKPHHTHACQECGHVWRPAIIATVGVNFLPGFKDRV